MRVVITFAGCEIDTARQELRRDGELVDVEPQVFAVLLHLIDHRDRVVPKTELLDAIWGDRFVSESALTSRISSARRAVGDDGRTQGVIKTVHGRGFRFVIDVEQAAAETTASRSESIRVEPADQTPMPALTELALLVDEEFPFVGRSELLERAAELAAAAVRGGLGAVLLGGEPGIGKTRLAAEMARRAGADGEFVVLGGRCDRHLASSLQPWLEAVGAWVNAASDEALERKTAGIASHLAAVFPTLQGRLQEPGSSGAVDEYAVLDALVVLIERITTDNPIVVVLDDVQWAGGATRALTSLLLRRGNARALLVLTFRTTIDDLGEAARDWLADLASQPIVSRVDLEPLGSDDVSRLVEQADIEPAIANQLWDLSGGHSLFATELLRDVRSGHGLPHLPDTVAALVRSRLDRLPADVSSLVSAGAAIGPDFSLLLAAEAAEISAGEALEAIETALGAELVHEVDGSADRFRFSHQLVPAAVLESMSAARRVHLHARLASAIDERGGPAAAVAHHSIEAFPILDGDHVIAHVRSTAAIALVDHQYDTATELLARCAELPMDEKKHAEVLIELGRAYNRAGHQPQALAPFTETVEVARRNGWVDLFAEAALGLWGQSPFRASQERTVTPLIDEALSYESDLPDSMTARLLGKRAAFTLFTRSLAERDRLSTRAMSLVEPKPSFARLEVLEARWMAIACPATAEVIRPIDDELLRLRKQLNARTTDACAPEIGPYWRGEGEELWRLAEELEADPTQRRDVDQWRTITLAGTMALFNGEFAEARQLTDEALPLGREPWGESGRVVHALVHLLIDLLDDSIGNSLDAWRQVAVNVPSDSMRATLAWVEAEAGDVGEATSVIESLGDRLDAMAENFMGGFGLVGYAETVLKLDRVDLFAPLIGVLDGLGDIMLGHPWAPSLATSDLLGRLHARVGDDEAADHHQVAAGRLYADIGAQVLAERLRA